MSPPQATSTTTVRAAGAVCWRRDGGSLKVLLVHRPRYDDWSWPKGKLDAGEVDPVAAVREVAEETGLRVQLGICLPTARYRLSDSTDKVVTYWAAQLTDGHVPPAPRPAEVDRSEWVTPEDAVDRLTRRGDRLQLQALLDADADGMLDTWPLLVVRHAAAHARATWDGDDAVRPLSAEGEQQSAQLADLLAAWHPPVVYTSPWRRCTDTVGPYVDASGAATKPKNRLTETGHRRSSRSVADLVGRLVSRGTPAAVCTHRPVLGTVLGSLAGHAAAGMRGSIPSKDPFLAPAEVFVAHVGRRSGRVVAVERHRTTPR